MKLNSTQIEQTLNQFNAHVIADVALHPGAWKNCSTPTSIRPRR